MRSCAAVWAGQVIMRQRSTRELRRLIVDVQVMLAHLRQAIDKHGALPALIESQELLREELARLREERDR